MIDCLRSDDVVLVCCVVDGAELIARWVQLNPAAFPAIIGARVTLAEPKRPDGLMLTVSIPDGLRAVENDVRFSIIPVDS